MSFESISGALGARASENAFYDMQHALYNLRHAMCNMNYTTCSMQHALYKVHRATCSIQHMPRPLAASRVLDMRHLALGVCVDAHAQTHIGPHSRRAH